MISKTTGKLQRLAISRGSIIGGNIGIALGRRKN